MLPLEMKLQRVRYMVVCGKTYCHTSRPTCSLPVKYTLVKYARWDVALKPMSHMAKLSLRSRNSPFPLFYVTNDPSRHSMCHCWLLQLTPPMQAMRTFLIEMLYNKDKLTVYAISFVFFVSLICQKCLY